MLFVWIFLILGALFIIALVDFVLRNPMFAETFVIKIGIPFTQIEYTQEEVGFIYIIAGSLLLGALVIAVSTWVLDAKRKFKVRSLRNELKKLKKAVEEAKASLPQQEEKEADEVFENADTEELTEPSETSLSPEEITKSFEDAVEGGDFLEKPLEEDSAEGEEPETHPTGAEESSEGNEKRLPQDTAIEAEVVDSDEQAVEDEATSEENTDEQSEEEAEEKKNRT
jgi:hypothetical protein